MPRPRIVLLQLPIPPPGPEPIRGNVPLAAGYLKLLAQARGLERDYEIEILPPSLVNELGDEGLVAAIVERRPAMVGLTCYLWNIDRGLWLAQRIKQRDPSVLVLLGGPEITADNAWVLESPAVDLAAVGEGEQTFCELLEAGRGGLRQVAADGPAIAGLWRRGGPVPAFRAPLKNLDAISSPYLAGILDAADEQMMMLETVRGCVFRCKFCYYPKSYDALYFVSREKVTANLRHAAARGAREIVLLDPTLNQRRDFVEFLELLAAENPDRQFTYFGELRGEGITPQTAALLRAANFSEVEIGLQSLDPHAQALMDRRVNRNAFERGARAMLDAGLAVRVDLILGLPGDTVDSFRANLDYLRNSGLYTSVQVFNLSVLPGTAFRQEAAELGLEFSSRPPYYVLRTPTLTLEDIYQLMDEAQEAFDIEFDPFPPPKLDFSAAAGPVRVARLDLDGQGQLPPAESRAQAWTLWLRAADFDARRSEAARWIRRSLEDNPHTTLQVVIDTPRLESVTERALIRCQEACYPSTSYLDRFYSLHPNPLLRAKRLIVLADPVERQRLDPDWTDRLEEYATIVDRGE